MSPSRDHGTLGPMVRRIGRRLPIRSFRKAERRGLAAALAGQPQTANPYNGPWSREPGTVRGYLARAWDCGWRAYASGLKWREAHYYKPNASGLRSPDRPRAGDKQDRVVGHSEGT